MASASTALPFGFVEPSSEDFGDFGRQVVRAADKGIQERRQHARMMFLPGVGFYVVYAVGVGTALSILGFELRGVALALATTVAFLGMGLLGHYYQSDIDGSALFGGMSSRHTALLIQAWVVRALTTAFFVLPYKVLRNLAHLSPRAPSVDARVLTVAIQIGSALDTSISLAQLRGIIPREVSNRTLEEAITLLWWGGLLEEARRSGDRVFLPTDRLRNWRLSGATGKAKVTRFTELMTR